LISEKHIMKLLKEFASTPEGKKVIKDTYGIDYDPKKDKGKTLQEYKKWGEEMKLILFEKTQPVINSISLDDILVGEPVKDKNGRYTLSISLQNVKRESLQPEKYPDGIENIVLHFSRGWSARGSVRGAWRGVDGVWSKRSREANPFVYDAIREFNQKAKKAAVATAGIEY